jgi:nicotinate-nucleotide pyrophosphorylase (carboxylating)
LSALSDLLIEPIVRAALAEDFGRSGDITSRACLDPGARFRGRYVVRQPGVLAGLACVRLAHALVDPQARFEAILADGDTVEHGQVVANIEGDAHAALAAERTALNLLCHLSGIATLTSRFVAGAAGTKARIVDTRKTTPGLRALEKYAVRMGGGANHRFGLDDAVLIKDNHVAACGGVAEAVRRARAAVGHMLRIEIEIDRLDQLEEALSERPDIVLLDNFALADLADAVRRTDGKALLEASGGVSLANVRAIAETGVDLISVGALTHSAPILDIGLDAI